VTRVRQWLRSPDVRWMLVILAVAFLVRLAIVLSVQPDPRDGRYDDTVWYDSTARHLAAGDGYVFDPTVWLAPDGSRIYPEENDLTPTALWPPGYPLTLAAIYKVTDDSVAAGRMANVVFGALTAALVFVIARRLFTLLPAVLAGFALALLPSHALFTAVLLSETYFGFLLALILAVCVYFVYGREEPNVPLIAGLGVLVAATGYVRGEFIAYGAVLALLMLLQWRRRAVLPLGAFALGALLIVTPWTLRNHDSMGEWIPGTTGAGRVMYQGHNEDTDGGPSLAAFWKLEEPYAGMSRMEIELEANRDGMREAWEFAQSNKLKELELVGRRMHLLFKTDESAVTWINSNKVWWEQENTDKLIQLSTFAFYGLVAAALFSIPAWWRWRDPRMWAVFGIVPFYMIMFGVLFIGDPRYHYAIYIPLAVFAGPGLALICRVTGAHWREAFGGRSLRSVLRREPTGT
jgi:4-amino-4-deoxy-L-arabinose transferase-like glycosyltransferase